MIKPRISKVSKTNKYILTLLTLTDYRLIVTPVRKSYCVPLIFVYHVRCTMEITYHVGFNAHGHLLRMYIFRSVENSICRGGGAFRGLGRSCHQVSFLYSGSILNPFFQWYWSEIFSPDPGPPPRKNWIRPSPDVGLWK